MVMMQRSDQSFNRKIAKETTHPPRASAPHTSPRIRFQCTTCKRRFCT